MSIKLINKIVLCAIIALLAIPNVPVFAVNYNKDLSISSSDIRIPSDILKGDKIKIYASVQNNSSYDLTGVVKFYNETTGSYMGADQSISVLPNKPDDVFVEWTATAIGEYAIAVRIVPWESNGDDPNNNKVTQKIYVGTDSDGDGVGDRTDNDDDNDGVLDGNDALPLNPQESKDTDKDGVGDNADTDDDSDGVVDVQDSFPQDSKESKDTDKDGVGDNQDAFPYDAKEWKDSDKDGVGDNADPNDNNKGPVPSINVTDTKTQIGKGLTFNAIKSNDPDGQIIKYEWNFGDGKIDTSVITNHSFSKSGQYIVTLKATDDKNESRIQQVLITVGHSIIFIILTGFISLILLLLILALIYKLYIKNKKVFKKDKKTLRR